MIALTIRGEPASKANQRQLVKFGNRTALIKSSKARGYERTADLQIPASARQMLEGPVRVSMRIYYSSERPDLDESVILDVLQARYQRINGERVLVTRGCYINDRQVRAKLILWGIDKANPRAEILIESMTADQAPLQFP